MDTFAFSKIKDLDPIAKANNIEVPRLRGYRLMGKETLIKFEKEDKETTAISCVYDLCHSVPFWNVESCCSVSSKDRRRLENFYLPNKNGCIEIRWDRIHGWKRKVLKTYIHNEIKKQKKQWETWNKYAGREDILYIHARIGGGNWPDYYKEVVNQPWFIEKVDDAYDSTYCDIYAKIKP
jgi:hypothetical protein